MGGQDVTLVSIILTLLFVRLLWPLFDCISFYSLALTFVCLHCRFISEILINVGSLKHVCSRFLFVGLFRHNEIDIDHPFAIQYARLHATTGGVKVTEIELSSLSKKDISDMLMVELRLPQRIVAPLADAVHKKTSGHAIFVVEMLNSLLRSSVIAYSPREQRYDWDQDAVELLQPGDGVAALIASNLKGLPATSQRKLQILSCFGIRKPGVV